MATLGAWGFPGNTNGKEPACTARDARDLGSIPGSGRSFGGGKDNPLLKFPWTEEPGGLQ